MFQNIDSTERRIALLVGRVVGYPVGFFVLLLELEDLIQPAAIDQLYEATLNFHPSTVDEAVLATVVFAVVLGVEVATIVVRSVSG